MEIYVVQPGDTLYSISTATGVSMSQLIQDNRPADPAHLAVGQTLVLQFPEQIHTVQPGETLYSIAGRYNITPKELKQNNPILEGQDTIWPGQTLVISFQGEKEGAFYVNGYTYPFINRTLFHSSLPYLSYLTPFTYGFSEEGEFVPIEDEDLIAAAIAQQVAPLMHLSSLTPEGIFSNELASLLLNNMEIQERLIDNLEVTLLEKGYVGLDVDFEFIFARDAPYYAAFISRLTQRFNPLGILVIVALAPKTSADQPGLLYEGHDYRALGEAANQLLLMTYEWGYAFGPPMAVAPIPNVRRVVEYAISEIPAQKLWLGIPNYGYDWPLPFVRGQTRATSISNQYAISLANRYQAAIQYDETAQAPWFRYTDERGRQHEVWFEDARSIRAKLALIPEYGLLGASYWNLIRPFPQNWRVLSALYDILDSDRI